jgi:type II secretory pathway component HofQ
MKKLLLPFVFTCATLMAADPIEPPSAQGKTQPARSIGQKGAVSEFQSDEIGLVLRTLARSANMNVVIRPEVRGTATLRITDKTPREVFDVIVEGYGYKSYNKNGVTYVVLKNQEQIDANRALAREKKALYDALVAEGFTKDEALKLLLAGIERTQ